MEGFGIYERSPGSLFLFSTLTKLVEKFRLGTYMVKAVKGIVRKKEAFRDPGLVRAGSGQFAEDGPGAVWLR